MMRDIQNNKMKKIFQIVGSKFNINAFAVYCVASSIARNSEVGWGKVVKC